MPSLIPLGEVSLNATAEVELAQFVHTGFFPATTLVEAPYPYPSSTSYPGDTYSTGLRLTVLQED